VSTDATEPWAHAIIILVDEAGHEHVVSDSDIVVRDDPHAPKLTSDDPVVVQRDYTIPVSRFALQVDTATRPYAGGSSASVQFLVNSRWTTPQILKQGGWHGGDVLRASFETQAWPSKVRLITSSTDAWCYRKITSIDVAGDEYPTPTTAHPMVTTTSGSMETKSMSHNGNMWFHPHRLQLSSVCKLWLPHAFRVKSTTRGRNFLWTESGPNHRSSHLRTKVSCRRAFRARPRSWSPPRPEHGQARCV